MSRGVGSYWCEACRRTFGGREAFRQAHFGRCLPARALRRRGFHQREDGTWTRTYDPRAPRQLRLFRVGRPARKPVRSAGFVVHARRAVPGTRGHRRHETSQLRLPLEVAA